MRIFLFSDLAAKLSQTPSLAKPDEGPTLQLNLEDEDEETVQEVDLDQIIAKSGSLTCSFIEMNPWHYPQEERQTFYQRNIQAVLCSVSSGNCYEKTYDTTQFIFRKK